MEQERLSVICRTARPADTADVLELTKTIWDGEDYVPQVWGDWLADPHGRLLVAEHAGKVVGLGKLTRLSELDWWLEGLRVAKACEGRGVASQMFAELLATWELTGAGSLRLMTSSARLPIHHLSERLGFTRVAEYGFFHAPIGVDETNPSVSPCEAAPTLLFRPLQSSEVGEAAAYALASPIQDLTGELIDLGWQMALPRSEYLQRAAGLCQAWWWRSRQGLVVYHEDREDQTHAHPAIELLACAPAAIVPLLLDLRRLLGSQRYADVNWIAPLNPTLLPHLQAAGFQHTWDHTLYVYAKDRRSSK